MARIKIRVEQRHIDNGKVSACRDCAVALAMREQMPEPYDVWVGYSNLRVGPAQWMPTPRSVKRFISKFDTNRLAAKPFNFFVTL